MVRKRNETPEQLNELVQKVQGQATRMAEKIWKDAGGVVETIEQHCKDLAENFKHYSKKEVGMYAALTVALTLALKSTLSVAFVFGAVVIGAAEVHLSKFLT